MTRGVVYGITCPRDGTPAWVLSLRGSYGRVLVDFCDDCSTVWFDRGELEAVMDSRELGELILHAAQMESGFRCPRCSGRLEVASLLDVVEEVCRHCKGIRISKWALERLGGRLAERAAARRGRVASIGLRARRVGRRLLSRRSS